jgi:SRSO17 transposase
MSGAELLHMSDKLERYLATYDELLSRPENREHFRLFARGQLGDLERKSLEPMADAAKVPPRGLQQFFTQYHWDEDGVRDRLQYNVAQKYGSADGIFIIDETSDGKKGHWTAGVARQYCGASGKIENCIVTVHLAYATGEFHALLDGELFLPECWNPNPQDAEITAKRKRAQIPDGLVHQTKTVLALGQLQRAKRNGVPGRWVSADETYGGKPWWRNAVADEGFWYDVEVPRNTMGWVRAPTGQRTPARTVEVLASAASAWRFKPWTQFKVHETDKGPEIWESKAGRFWEQGDNASEEAQWLLIARNPRTGEMKYFLSNAPEDIPLITLVRVAFSRWHVERCFEDCKSELGLDHAELRNYRGLHRHLILTAVNYLFLMDELGLEQGGKKADLTVSQLGDALQELLKEKARGVLTRSQLRAVADQLAADMQLTQERKRRARRSHRKQRLRELHGLGIFISRLPFCDG